MGLQRRGRAALSLNARQIGELVQELRPLLLGWRLRDVQHQPPRDLVLVLEPPEDARELPAVRRLRLSADPEHARVHLVRARLPRPEGPPGPFFRRVAAELAGARLSSLAQVRGDRILCLEFRDTPSGEARALFAELTGRHANLVLCGASERVLEVLVPAEPERVRSGAARLAPGLVWSPPPGRSSPPASLPSIADEFPAAEPEAGGPAPEAGAPLSWRVECSLSRASAERERERAQKQLERRASRRLANARSLLAGLERKLAACAEAERVRLDGELLAANTHRLKRGMKEVLLEDWYAEGAPARRIELDPRRGPAENVEHFFERYRKLESTREAIPADIARAKQRIARLEELLSKAADPALDPEALDAEAVRAGLLDAPQEADERKRKPPPPRLPYRSFVGTRGSEIRVGRNARDNDDLTFHHARGNDLWLHTADAPGSHVVLCTGGRAEPDPEELLDAAHLALHFSPLRGAARASVHVCRRKEVHKPRGAKPGLVTVAGGRKLDLRLQPERLARLLSRGRSPAPEGGEAASAD